MPDSHLFTLKIPKVLLYLSIALFCAACTTPSPPTPTRPVHVIKISSASATAPLLAALVETFEQTTPDVRIQIQTVNSAWALKQLQKGQADLAAIASDPPDELWRTPIALDGIALIVHPDNPIDALTEAQAQAIFGGRLWHWKDLGVTMTGDEITVLSREQGSGDRIAFEARIMKETPVTPAAILLYGAPAVVDFVATHPNAIGYVSQAMVSEQVKALRMEDVAPMPESIARQEYGLIRPLYLVAVEEPAGAARAFLDFCLSEQGQTIVARRYATVRKTKP